MGNKKDELGLPPIETIAKRYNFKLSDPIADLPKEALEVILHGGKETFAVASKSLGVTRKYKIDYEGMPTSSSTNIKKPIPPILDVGRANTWTNKNVKVVRGSAQKGITAL